MAKDLKTLFGNAHNLDIKSVEFLTNSLERSNLPGFDYIEYKQSLGALSEMDMDESTAFKSAFATASTMGLTKAKLIETASHYKSVILKEKTHFDEALKNRTQQKVEGKRQEVEKLKEQINKHREKIAQLEEQMKKYQTTIDGADAQIQSETEKIESTRENFEHTHQSILNQIDKDIANINQYL